MRRPSGRSCAGRCRALEAAAELLAEATRSGLRVELRQRVDRAAGVLHRVAGGALDLLRQGAGGDDRDALAAQLAAGDVRERGGVEAVALGELVGGGCARATSASSRSPRSDERTSLLACETTESPSVAPSTMPMPSARKTATSDSAW